MQFKEIIAVYFYNHNSTHAYITCANAQLLTVETYGTYSSQITSCSPQEMRAEVMFVTIQCEKIRPSKKEHDKALTIQ
jgi:hypothetical protein